MNYFAAALARRDQEVGEGFVLESARRSLLEHYGHFALAYSVAFQPGLLRFGDETGFIAYRMVGRTAFALADPLAPRAQWERLVDAFVAQKEDVTFWQVSHGMAAILAGRGFSVNELGLENWIDLDGYDFSGPRKRSFRTAENRLTRSGHRVAEMPLGVFDPARLEAISLGWRRTRTTKRRELSFLVRPVVLHDEPGVRKFFLLDRDDKPVAFAFFDPLYEEGRIVGYLSATRRWLPDADPLSAYFLVRRAIETFQHEGVPRLYFGLMPFHRIEDKEFTKDWLTRRAFRFIYTNPIAQRLVYPTQTLARHKEGYGGESRQTYCAMNKIPSLPRLLKLIRACGVV
ncbi:DUF2156 domain-containing protein [Chelativorans sp. M5D2P16]|uniref:DUF2156 domain-containing protein n=1 Tax=Chelativorans sp. M5D2P16 TaxID=3095678 RepID=UPI002ACA5E3B|nr:DUF2156 domain-containing protein [Chelativorans sp. M5D2P16]MDZ5699024.1 DUF2156 domain-containing protein [Chelativorans sp. M5D2P16]